LKDESNDPIAKVSASQKKYAGQADFPVFCSPPPPDDGIDPHTDSFLMTLRWMALMVILETWISYSLKREKKYGTIAATWLSNPVHGTITIPHGYKGKRTEDAEVSTFCEQKQCIHSFNQSQVSAVIKDAPCD
jgi:hypothetical protein